MLHFVFLVYLLCACSAIHSFYSNPYAASGLQYYYQPQAQYEPWSLPSQPVYYNQYVNHDQIPSVHSQSSMQYSSIPFALNQYPNMQPQVQQIPNYIIKFQQPVSNTKKNIPPTPGKQNKRPITQYNLNQEQQKQQTNDEQLKQQIDDEKLKHHINDEQKNDEEVKGRPKKNDEEVKGRPKKNDEEVKGGPKKNDEDLKSGQKDNDEDIKSGHKENYSQDKINDFGIKSEINDFDTKDKINNFRAKDEPQKNDFKNSKDNENGISQLNNDIKGDKNTKSLNKDEELDKKKLNKNNNKNNKNENENENENKNENEKNDSNENKKTSSDEDDKIKIEKKDEKTDDKNKDNNNEIKE